MTASLGQDWENGNLLKSEMWPIESDQDNSTTFAKSTRNSHEGWLGMVRVHKPDPDQQNCPSKS